LNILGGVQPGWLKTVFPEEAWSTGLTSRMIMIYSSEVPLLDIFASSPDNSAVRARIVAKLGQISEHYGQLHWTPEAQAKLGKWHLDGGPPTPSHSRLTHYVRRRTLHVLKLIIISAIARGSFDRVELYDVDRALAWLLSAEKLMPDIFRAMIGRSDVQVLEELHHFVTTRWHMSAKKPISEVDIFAWLSARVPSDKIRHLLEVAERAGIMERLAGTTSYKPLPKYNTGVE
jgi:hypothetical protein